MVGLFQAPIRPRRPVSLKPVTLRDFSGGLNSVDTDDLLVTKFAIALDNMLIGTDGSLGGRFGTSWFNNFASVATGNAVNMIYFADRLIVVTTTGQVCAITDAGVATLIWSNAIAGAIPPGGNPGWGTTDHATFVPFKRLLVVHNGIHKPIQIALDLTVTYLTDPATDAGHPFPENIWVPIGKYGCTVANYHVIAGITATGGGAPVAAPTQISISSSGTPGVFRGASLGSGDAIDIDVGAYASLGAQEIRGVAGFRNLLLVYFRDSTLVITLGNYTQVTVSSVVVNQHTPLYNDTLTKFGLLDQRGITYLDNDILFSAPHGLASAKRNIFAGLIESKTLSEIVKPTYNSLARVLTDTQEKLNTFSVRDTANNTIYNFFLGGVALAYTFNETLRVRGWSRITGWPWSCGCESKQGRVFFAEGTKVFRMGNTTFAGEAVYADKVKDRDRTWSNTLAVTAGQKVYDPVTTRVWTALSNLTTPGSGTMLAYVEANPLLWSEYLGIPINIDWELPWSDLKEPERIKTVRTIKIATKGTARFTISVFVDGLYKDELGNVIHSPALSEEFVGSDQQGFGGSPDQAYGGGRNSQDPRLYKFPVRFKRAKLRVTASVMEKISFSYFSFMHHRGTMHRP